MHQPRRWRVDVLGEHEDPDVERPDLGGLVVLVVMYTTVTRPRTIMIFRSNINNRLKRVNVEDDRRARARQAGRSRLPRWRRRARRR